MEERILTTKPIKIAAMLTVEVGLDTLKILLARINIGCVITLRSKSISSSTISGYTDVSNFCKNAKLKCIQVSSYSLSQDNDIACVVEEDIDILLVLGWQRLIPDWLIKHVKIAVLGSHGSAYGITEGRGRSPQNWALIMGEKKFTLSLFKIDAGIDSGNIISERTFEYSCCDNIETSYLKVSWLMAEMIFEVFSYENMNIFLGKPQQGDAFYLPQRKPDDGMIDWKLDAESIYNLVRALTNPYPGAFSTCGNVKVIIWDAIPFKIPVNISMYSIGEICQIFHNNFFAVKCGNDEFLLIKKWTSSANWEPVIGSLFNECDQKEIYSKIIERHYRSYSPVEQKLHPKILEMGQ